MFVGKLVVFLPFDDLKNVGPCAVIPTFGIRQIDLLGTFLKASDRLGQSELKSSGLQRFNVDRSLISAQDKLPSSATVHSYHCPSTRPRR